MIWQDKEHTHLRNYSKLMLGDTVFGRVWLRNKPRFTERPYGASLAGGHVNRLSVTRSNFATKQDAKDYVESLVHRWLKQSGLVVAT